MVLNVIIIYMWNSKSHTFKEEESDSGTDCAKHERDSRKHTTHSIRHNNFRFYIMIFFIKILPHCSYALEDRRRPFKACLSASKLVVVNLHF